LVGDVERNLGLAQCLGEEGNKHASESFGLAEYGAVPAGRRELEAVMYVE
jgi:hypothetical protein